MKILFLSLLAVAGCSYKYQLDNQGLDELRAQQAQTTDRLNEIEKHQAENDAKIRVMWTHGK